VDSRTLKRKLKSLDPSLDERTRRLTLGAEAKSLGRGGIAQVARATGASPNTIRRGMRELEAGETLPPGRVRRAGGGRKKASANDSTLLRDLEKLVDPGTRGDPESPTRWTATSLRVLARELQKLGHEVSHVLVGRLLREQGYSLQANRKTKEGKQHPDRDAQFRHIDRQIQKQQQAGEPVISVDTKKKELVGQFKNAGREWRPRGMPERVSTHDFPTEQGKAVPYGVYDLARNEGFVSVGIDHDTAEFAVHTIARWWTTMGRARYPEAKSILILADAGGSNGNRLRLWKVELQKLADKTGLTFRVCHYPPGTSKWNKIEHRLFSFVTQNWRGKPLRTLATIVSLIAATRTSEGLKVRCELDEREYRKGIKISKAQMASVNLRPERFHGE